MLDLRTQRVLRNETQKQSAKLMGISEASLVQYEKKRVIPSFFVACKLADHYDVSLEELRIFFKC